MCSSRRITSRRSTAASSSSRKALFYARVALGAADEAGANDWKPEVLIELGNLSVAEGYGTFVEFYYPGCGTMIENELLPEGYPPTYDIEPDLDALRAKYSEEK